MMREPSVEDRRLGKRRFLLPPLPPASIILVFVWLSVAEAMTAASEPVVVALGLAPVEARLRGIGADGAVLFDGGATTADAGARNFSVKADDLVRWGHAATPRAQASLVSLTDGSLMVTAADWSDKAAVELEGDTLRVRSVAWDDVRLPRSLVAGIVFALHERPQYRRQLEQRLRKERGEKDLIWLTNEDRIAGRLIKLFGDTLVMDVAGRETTLPLSRVEMVAFEARARPPGVAVQPKLIVALRDGSLLYARGMAGVDGSVNLELAGGEKLTGGNVDDIVALVGLGGEKFVYLSSIEPAEYRHVPYLTLEWPFRRDENVLGELLCVDGKRYLRGIGMHSAARLTYRLNGNFRRFEAEAALDDSSQGRGSVTFGVYLLRDGQWKQAAVGDVVRGGAPPEPVSVDVRGAEMMTLTVDFADRGDELDHADWLDARLIKN